MSVYLPFIIGIILVIWITMYLIKQYTKKKTKAIREQIIIGQKPYLAHWVYDDINIVDFQSKLGSLQFYRKKLAEVKEIYICEDGVLFGEAVFFEWSHYSLFIQLEIIQKKQPCIQFKIQYGRDEHASISDFVVPIPDGKEKEATTVVETLLRIVRFSD